MILLSTAAEKVLNDILDHRDNHGNCDTEYWKNRFDNNSFAEDVNLRSLFKELKDEGMISYFWADNYPYQLLVLAKGNNYFEDKKRSEKMETKRSYTNNFYGNASNIMIQQGNINSSQIIDNPFETNWDRIEQLINEIKKYDSALENEYGKQNAEEIRKSEGELIEAVAKKDTEKTQKILMFIRDLSVNASGGLIASGILQLVSSILR